MDAVCRDHFYGTREGELEADVGATFLRTAEEDRHGDVSRGDMLIPSSCGSDNRIWQVLKQQNCIQPNWIVGKGIDPLMGE